MDINDLWIGDLVQLKKSNRVGKYEGSKNGKALINIQGKKVLTPASNLLPYEEPEAPLKLDLSEERPSASHRPDRVLDLHIEKLQPALTHALPERIVTYQVAAAREHVEAAIKHRYLTIELIHGKGEGVLKLEVRHLLSLYDEVRATFDKNQGGSTEVWFDWTT